MATPNIIGKSCGEFTVEKHIGKGTFGQVYLVTRTDQIPSRTGSFQVSFFFDLKIYCLIFLFKHIDYFYIVIQAV